MSIYKRPGTPNFYYRFEAKGREFRGSTGTADRREAKRREAAEREKVLKDIAAGKSLTTIQADTVDAVFARYISAHASKLKWGAAVIDHLACSLTVIGGQRLFADIKTNDIALVLEAYERTEVAPGTVNRRKDVLRGVWHMARDVWDMQVQNIKWSKLERDEPKERVRWLSDDETMALLRLLPRHIKIMFMWALCTGCRLNEQESLSWDRVNLDAATVEVLTKGGGTRFVHLNAVALSILIELKKERPDADFVFDSTNRRKHWEKARRVAGIKDIRWHDARHDFATKLGWSGATLQVVQHALGHSKITTTERYSHTVARNISDAVKKLPIPKQDAEPAQQVGTVEPVGDTLSPEKPVNA